MHEPRPEHSPQSKLEAIQAAHPEVDIVSLAAGTLAGPASPDRPPVPVWQYLDYLAQHPELSTDDISRARFPTLLHSGVTTVTSIDELTAPGPRAPTYPVQTADIVRLYRLMYEAGAMRWNPETRTHEEVEPAASYVQPVYGQWRRELEEKAAGHGRDAAR